jgi:hypothetical protein
MAASGMGAEPCTTLLPPRSSPTRKRGSEDRSPTDAAVSSMLLLQRDGGSGVWVSGVHGHLRLRREDDTSSGARPTDGGRTQVDE